MTKGERQVTHDFIPGCVGPAPKDKSAQDPPRDDTPDAQEDTTGSGARARYVGPYRLISLIGEGAMGRVFHAEHATLGRQVAVKVMRPELARDLGCMQRFFAEARAVNRVKSDHLVEVTDLCRDPCGDTYLVMELLNGMDLYDLQASTQLSLPRSLTMVSQLCQTLVAVHESGIVHRDLKPENVFVTQRKGGDFIKLLDFGIAKHTDTVARSVRRTAPGILLGTPQYMAPEQATASDVDHRTDIYAVGVILFQLLTDRLPFQAPELNVLLHDIAYTPAPAPSKFITLPRCIRKPMDNLVRKCLHKDPACRPQSALDVAHALQGMLELLNSVSANDNSYPIGVPHDDDETPMLLIHARTLPSTALPISCGRRPRRSRAKLAVWAAVATLAATLAWQLSQSAQFRGTAQALQARVPWLASSASPPELHSAPLRPLLDVQTEPLRELPDPPPRLRVHRAEAPPQSRDIRQSDRAERSYSRNSVEERAEAIRAEIEEVREQEALRELPEPQPIPSTKPQVSKQVRPAAERVELSNRDGVMNPFQR